MQVHKRHEMRSENNNKDCALKCAQKVCCSKAKWLGSQFLYIQFLSVAALKILCVKGRCVRDGRPLERCDGLKVVMLKAVQEKKRVCSVCACPKANFLLVFFMLLFCLPYIFFTIFSIKLPIFHSFFTYLLYYKRHTGRRTLWFLERKKKFRGLSPRANYTDRAAAAGRRI